METKLKYRRILLKFSGEFLGDRGGSGISIDSFGSLAGEIRPLLKSGIRIGVVLGAGNIFRGSVERQKEKSRLCFTQTEADRAGMFGTLINSILFSDFLSQQGVKNRLLSALFTDSVEFFNAQKAVRYLEEGFVNIYAGGTSNPFFTTDSAAVLKALETGCDVLIKATKVDGVFDRDPKKHAHARFFSSISPMEVIRKKLKVMDLTAMSLAMENHLPVVVMNFFKKGNLAKLVRGIRIGTIIRDC